MTVIIKPKQGSYVCNDWYDHHSRATTTVHTDSPSVMVTWRNEEGKRFRAIVRQKPNPIGFHARLPGDGRQDK